MLVNNNLYIKPESIEPQSVLIAEDHPAERMRLESMLQKMGYLVNSFSNGIAALRYIESNPVDIIISDWKMPIMNGLDLCKKIRSDTHDHYPYFILLTGCDTKPDLIAGMDAGADDFITKPFNREELRVRLQAGSRIQHLKQQLELKNAHLEKVNQSLQLADELLNKDLTIAAYMQQELLPKNHQLFSNWSAASLFEPASHVSGDTFNLFKINKHYMGFYHIDVSGHGVSAAMMSFTIARLIGSGSGSIDELIGAQKKMTASPADVVHQLNLRFQNNQLHTPYFTMLYGIIDIESGQGTFCQAGHPHPFIVRNNGQVEKLGQGGFPVGALEDANYQNTAFQLHEGDRFLVYSDGITECRNNNDELTGEIRLTELLENSQHQSITDIIRSIDKLVRLWRAERHQDDDISALLIERSANWIDV